MDYNELMNAYRDDVSARKGGDKAVVKQIADAALSDLSGGQNTLNNNYNDAVKTAYLQGNQNTGRLQSETAQISANANTGNVVRNLELGRKYNNQDYELARQGVNNNLMKANDNIDITYDNSANLNAMMQAKDTNDRAVEQAAQDKRDQEGYMDELVRIANDYDLNYDFDADIFALEQAGYTSDSWQIQYLKEAKRLQSRMLAERKALEKGSSGRGNGSGGDEVWVPDDTSGTNMRDLYNIQNMNFSENELVDLAKYVGRDLADIKRSPSAWAAYANVVKLYESGRISESEAKRRLDQLTSQEDMAKGRG